MPSSGIQLFDYSIFITEICGRSAAHQLLLWITTFAYILSLLSVRIRKPKQKNLHQRNANKSTREINRNGVITTYHFYSRGHKHHSDECIFCLIIIARLFYIRSENIADSLLDPVELCQNDWAVRAKNPELWISKHSICRSYGHEALDAWPSVENKWGDQLRGIDFMKYYVDEFGFNVSSPKIVCSAQNYWQFQYYFATLVFT